MAPNRRQGRGLRILSVDDEADLLHGVKTVLEGDGFVVDAFDDPGRALSNFRAGAYDLLIFDVRMPKMPGLQLYREVTKMDRTPKVVFFSAFEILEREWTAMFPETVVATFIGKSIGRQELVQRLLEVATS